MSTREIVRYLIESKAVLIDGMSVDRAVDIVMLDGVVADQAQNYIGRDQDLYDRYILPRLLASRHLFQ